jgi:hypothetical protein
LLSPVLVFLALLKLTTGHEGKSLTWSLSLLPDLPLPLALLGTMFLVLTQKLTFNGQAHPRGSVFQVAADDPGEGPLQARPVALGGKKPLPFKMDEAGCFPIPLDRAVKCPTWEQAVTAARRLG